MLSLLKYEKNATPFKTVVKNTYYSLIKLSALNIVLNLYPGDCNTTSNALCNGNLVLTVYYYCVRIKHIAQFNKMCLALI